MIQFDKIVFNVALSLKGNPHLEFYLINLTHNEPKSLKVEETPVLYLYPPRDANPIKFRGPMKSRHILDFLSKHLRSKLNEYLLDGSAGSRQTTGPSKSCSAPQAAVDYYDVDL